MYAGISRYISVSNEIEFAWSENKDRFKHTAIVLKFDGKPVFTIDYGHEGGYFGSSKYQTPNFGPLVGSSHEVLGGTLQSVAVTNCLLIPGSDLRINGVDLSKVKTIKYIGKFVIDTPERKKFIENLISDIISIEMGEYSALSNNCRHFVEKAFGVIGKAQKQFYKDGETSDEELDELDSSAKNNYSDLQKVKQQDRNVLTWAIVGLSYVIDILSKLYRPS